jgi:hypothetical protein
MWDEIAFHPGFSSYTAQETEGCDTEVQKEMAKNIEQFAAAAFDDLEGSCAGGDAQERSGQSA